MDPVALWGTTSGRQDDQGDDRDGDPESAEIHASNANEELNVKSQPINHACSHGFSSELGTAVAGFLTRAKSRFCSRPREGKHRTTHCWMTPSVCVCVSFMVQHRWERLLPEINDLSLDIILPG